MFCVKCGNRNDDDSRFCVYCGAVMERDESDSTVVLLPLETWDAPQSRQQQQPQDGLPASFAGDAGEWERNHLGPETASFAAVSVSPRETLVEQKGKGERKTLIIALVAVIVAALAAAAIATFIFKVGPIAGLLSDSTSSSSASTEFVAADADSTPPSDAADSDIIPEGAPAIKASVDEYTWAELSGISKLIENASGSDAVLRIAKTYNLVNADGKLDGSQVKSVELADGRTAHAQIIGFKHDAKTSGGMAGITFLFKEAVAIYAMNNVASNSGGWNGSDMARWLNSDFAESALPDDLKDVIVYVNKDSNNVGRTESASSVSESADRLWLPSARELAGKINWASGKKAYANEVMNAEGFQYLLFSDEDVDNDDANVILAKTDYSGAPITWWTRTSRAPSEDMFYFVDETGNPHNPDGAAYESRGVVPGFCI